MVTMPKPQKCTRCPAEAEPNRRRCTRCLVQAAQEQKARYWKRRVTLPGYTPRTYKPHLVEARS